MAIFVIKFFVAININRLILRFSAKQGARLCAYLMKSFQSMDYSKYILRNSSEYLYSINTLSLNFGLILQACLRFTSETIVAISIFILLASNNIYILLFLSTLLIGAIFLYDKFFRNILFKYGQLRHLAMQSQLKAINEGIAGIKEVRILSKEKFFHEIVRENSLNYAKYYVTTNLISTSPRYFLEILLVFFIVLMVYFNIKLGNNVEELLPLLAMFGVASVRLLPTASQLMTSIAQIRNGREAISLLYKDLIFHKKLEDLDKLVPEFPRESQLKDNIKSENFSSLKLENVSFTYPESKLISCNNVDLEIKEGEMIGIIGASGAGKTTLVDLMLGLLSPSSGKIEFNGKDINEDIKGWNSKIAYLPQEIFIIDQSIRKNITLAEDNEEIDEELLFESISKSKLSAMISELTSGVETILGEKGIRLSGGQKQRVAIARAFYHQRDVLFFDEATSSLDVETENEIMNEIRLLKGIKTMIIITHRLQTVKNCDRIYKIDKGKIVQSGTYKEVVGQ